MVDGGLGAEDRSLRGGDGGVRGLGSGVAIVRERIENCAVEMESRVFLVIWENERRLDDRSG